MVVRAYKDIKIQDKRRAMIDTCNSIVAEYVKRGLRLTLRQLYYQCVSRNIIPNVERSYKNLGNTISDARLAGLMDWDAIEDRGRVAQMPSQWQNIKSLVESAVAAYRLPRWKGQECYVELWVEKQALAGVLEPLSDEFHAVLMINKGYSSQSAMYSSAQRFRRAAAIQPGHERSLLLYLGDHDPSGEDMVRDVRDRLEMFGVQDLEVRKIALTMEQIEEHDPPPNPAKTTDSRSEAYIAEHGESSWEVDALPPDILQQLIRDAFEEVIDRDKMDKIIEREERDKEELRKAAEKILKKSKKDEDAEEDEDDS